MSDHIERWEYFRVSNTNKKPEYKFSKEEMARQKKIRDKMIDLEEERMLREVWE